jgi:hypothetical protein
MSLSLKVSDQRITSPISQLHYERLLTCIYQHLSCPKNLPRLTSTDILVNVNVNNVNNSIHERKLLVVTGRNFSIVSLFQMNPKAGFSNLSEPEQMC